MNRTRGRNARAVVFALGAIGLLGVDGSVRHLTGQSCTDVEFGPPPLAPSPWRFGRTIAIDGDVAVAGAPFSTCGTGAAIVLRLDAAGEWQEEARLFPPAVVEGEVSEFSVAVAVSGDVAVVGGIEPSDSGSATVFRRESSTGEWIVEQILAPAIPGGDGTGRSVAIDGDLVLVGAPHAAGIAPVSGAVRAYRWDPVLGTWSIEGTFAASDGATDDAFGWSIAIAGDLALIGAPGAAVNDLVEGKAYLFRRLPAGDWVEEQVLTPISGSSGHSFGRAVALAGDRAFVGVPSSSPGAVQVFRETGGLWLGEAHLVPPATSDGIGFGASVAADGEFLLVGVPGPFEPSADPGSAVLFRFDTVAAEWVSVHEFSADSLLDFRFGSAVGLQGDHILVGAPGPVFAVPLLWRGSVHAFSRDPGTGEWGDEQEIRLSSPVDHDLTFGSAVAIHGDRAIVGAPASAELGFVVGSARTFAFDPTTALWSERQLLLPHDAVPFGEFGHAVAFEGEWALVGAPGVLPDGAAYLFRFDTATGIWIEEQKLVPGSDIQGGFGRSVALHGEVAVIGCRGVQLEIDSYGTAFVFRREEGGFWVEEQQLLSPAAALPNTFGESVATDGETCWIGQPYTHPGAGGAVILYRREPVGGEWTIDQVISDIDGLAGILFGRHVAIDAAAELALVAANAESNLTPITLVLRRDPASGVWETDALLPGAIGQGSAIDSQRVFIANGGTVQVFRRDPSGAWIEVAGLEAAESSPVTHFGRSVAASGIRAIVGAPATDATWITADCSSVHLFDLAVCIPPVAFIRGDANHDGTVLLADPIHTLSFLFSGGAAACHDALDANDDGAIDVADPVAILQHLFLGAAPPPAPYPACGVDPTGDTLGCIEPLACP